MTMSKREFQSLVEQAFEALPDNYRTACEGLSIRIEDHASDDVMASLQVSNPYELLGLYHGINLTQKSVFDLPSQPDEILIYRKPIIAFAKARSYELADVVQHVLIHEIGHHLGFSDADMDLIERS